VFLKGRGEHRIRVTGGGGIMAHQLGQGRVERGWEEDCAGRRSEIDLVSYYLNWDEFFSGGERW